MYNMIGWHEKQYTCAHSCNYMKHKKSLLVCNGSGSGSLPLPLGLDHNQYYQGFRVSFGTRLQGVLGTKASGCLWHDLIPTSCLVMSLDLEHLPMKDSMYMYKDKHLRQMDNV